MTSERKKWIVLGGLVGLWILLIVIQRSQTARVRPTAVSSVPRRVTVAQRPGSARRPQKQGEQPVEIPRLHLHRLERVRPAFEPEARNIFASIEPSSAFPPSPRDKPQVATPSIPPPPDPFLEESKKLRFLGYAEADGKAMAFVSYESEVLVVPEKGTFGRLFQVKKVEEDILILSSTDGTKEVRLELGPGPEGPITHRGDQRGKRP